MNKIDGDELFRHFSDFLKVRGVELKDGGYAQQIQKGCGLLADTVNLSQETFERAKVEMDKQLDNMRQIIHQTTAPPSKPPQATGAKSARAKTKPKRKGR